MNCAIHPEKNGSNLCLKCGNWYCSDCIDNLNGQSICKRCKYGQPNRVYYSNPITKMQNLIIQLSREWKNIFLVIYFVLFVVLLVFSIYLTFRYKIYFLYIPTASYLLGGLIFYTLFIRK